LAPCSRLPISIWVCVKISWCYTVVVSHHTLDQVPRRFLYETWDSWSRILLQYDRSCCCLTNKWCQSTEQSQSVYMVWLKTSLDKNCNFSELTLYFTTKFCTTILKGCLHYYCTFYKILLIYIEMAGSDIWSTIFVSCQAAMQNIYLKTYQNKN